MYWKAEEPKLVGNVKKIGVAGRRWGTECVFGFFFLVYSIAFLFTLRMSLAVGKFFFSFLEIRYIDVIIICCYDSISPSNLLSTSLERAPPMCTVCTAGAPCIVNPLRRHEGP